MVGIARFNGLLLAACFLGVIARLDALAQEPSSPLSPEAALKFLLDNMPERDRALTPMQVVSAEITNMSTIEQIASNQLMATWYGVVATAVLSVLTLAVLRRRGDMERFLAPTRILPENRQRFRDRLVICAAALLALRPDRRRRFARSADTT